MNDNKINWFQLNREHTSKIMNGRNVIRYISNVPCLPPYITNQNVYHNTDTNEFVLEFPGSGSTFMEINEEQARQIIECSVVDEEYAKWKREYNEKYSL